LMQIGKTTDPNALLDLAKALTALPVKLTDAQAQQATEPPLLQIGKTTDPDVLRALVKALTALPVKLTDARAQQAFVPLLQQIGQTADPYTLQALAEVLQALPVKLTEAQAQQAFAPLRQQISQTTNPATLRVLANWLATLAETLTEKQAPQALAIAMSSLGWAATEDEAVNWARALVALLPRATNQDGDRELVGAIVYPFAAGPATEVLLDAIRARHSDAPTKEAGTAAGLAWIAQKYPDQVRRPICPIPAATDLVVGPKMPCRSSIVLRPKRARGHERRK
jgi:hypothetical protein